MDKKIIQQQFYKNLDTGSYYFNKVETYDQIQEQTDKKKKKGKKGFRKMIKRVLKKEASALFEKMTS